MSRLIILFAAFSGFFYVALGAIGAHLLAPELDSRAMQWIQTGLQYQGFHTLALLFLAVMGQRGECKPWNWSAALFILGIFLFSGSLYGLALMQIKFFSYLTPVGGICFLLGWCVMFRAAMMIRGES